MQRVGTVCALLSVALVTVAHGQATDHETCYKIKDPLKLAAIVDLNSPQFGLENGCQIGAAKFFCVPASKSIVAAEDKKTHLPIVPLPVYAPPAPVDRVCYKAKCPEPFPADQSVTDQFGNRTLSKFKPMLLCTPAVKGAGFCGNGVIDAGEACDGAALGGCATCRADCTCGCETACCYVENFLVPPDTQCVQYTGTPAQIAVFAGACSALGIGAPASLPGFSMRNSVVAGACAAGPTFGTPCVPGPPTLGNLHVMPSDSTCP